MNYMINFRDWLILNELFDYTSNYKEVNKSVGDTSWSKEDIIYWVENERVSDICYDKESDSYMFSPTRGEKGAKERNQKFIPYMDI